MLNQWFALALLTLISTSIAACSSSGMTTVPREKAHQWAHNALLVPGELPGDGWGTTETDQFREYASYPRTPACTPQQDAWDALLNFKNVLVARAQTKIVTNSRPGVEPIGIQQWVEVYQSSSQTADLLKQMQFVWGPTSIDCIREISAAGTRSLSVEKTDHRGPAPQPGVIRATLYSGGDLKEPMREQHLFWSKAEVSVRLIINGPDKALTAEFFRDVVNQIETKLNRLSK